LSPKRKKNKEERNQMKIKEGKCKKYDHKDTVKHGSIS
jgi:hypothetical protein